MTGAPLREIIQLCPFSTIPKFLTPEVVVLGRDAVQQWNGHRHVQHLVQLAAAHSTPSVLPSSMSQAGAWRSNNHMQNIQTHLWCMHGIELQVLKESCMCCRAACKGAAPAPAQLHMVQHDLAAAPQHAVLHLAAQVLHAAAEAQQAQAAGGVDPVGGSDREGRAQAQALVRQRVFEGCQPRGDAHLAKARGGCIISTFTGMSAQSETKSSQGVLVCPMLTYPAVPAGQL